jgi:hypothetical protein
LDEKSENWVGKSLNEVIAGPAPEEEEKEDMVFLWEWDDGRSTCKVLDREGGFMTVAAEEAEARPTLVLGARLGGGPLKDGELVFGLDTVAERFGGAKSSSNDGFVDLAAVPVSPNGSASLAKGSRSLLNGSDSFTGVVLCLWLDPTEMAEEPDPTFRGGRTGLFADGAVSTGLCSTVAFRPGKRGGTLGAAALLAGAADIDTAFSVRDTAADAGEADREGTRGTNDCIDLDDMFGETLRVSAEPPRGTSGSRGVSTAFGEDADCPAGLAGMAGGGFRPAAASPGSSTAPMPPVLPIDRARSGVSDGPADGLIDGLGLMITGEEVEEELERGSVKVDVVLLPLLRMTGFLATAGFAGAGRAVEAAAGALDTFSNAAILLLMSFGAASAASASLSLLAIAILPLGGRMNAVQI